MKVQYARAQGRDKCVDTHPSHLLSDQHPDLHCLHLSWVAMSEEQNDTSSSSQPSSSGGLSGWLFGRDNFLGRFADEQRIGRLRNCHDLESVHKKCMRRRAHALKGGKLPETEEERSGQEKKIDRFYGWNEMAHKKGPTPGG
eukprot:6129029-Ditylum_brightwellii.AAC.1